MPSNVLRRNYLRIATGSIVTLPAVAAASIVSVPHQALAATGQETTDQEATTDKVLYTNEVQLIPLTPSEVAFVVCDVSVGDPTKNRVAGARVKVTSTATGKSVEDITKDDGSVMFDIKELAIRNEDESSEDLKQYVFIGKIEVVCDGYRDFLTGQMIVEGMQTHVIPTRKLEEGMPYPARVSFDGWDVLYTDNTPSFSPANDIVHFLDITLKNVLGSSKIHVALAEAATDKVVRSLDATPSGSEMTCRFGYHFLQQDNDEALTPETDYCIQVSQGDTTWKFPIRLKPKTPVIDKPGTTKTLKPVKPVGDPAPKGARASATLPRLIPIGGGESLSGWIPDIGPVHVTVDPCGSAGFSLTIGEMEYPWGKSSEWNTPSADGQAGRSETINKGNISGTATDDDIKFEKNAGWKTFPSTSLKKQWQKKKDDIAKGKNNYQQAKASPDNNNISFSKVLKVNLKLVFFGTVTWDLLTKDSWDISANLNKNPGFSGAAGLALILTCDYTYCNNFLAGPVPVLFQFGFKAIASAKATLGLVVRDTDPYREDKIKEGLPVKSWSEILGDRDYWNWDSSNTGFSLTLTFSPWISLGVGVKGVVSLSVRGSIAMTYYVGACFPKSKLQPGQENPHMIWGISAALDLVFELFFFTINVNVVDLSNKNFYNSWNDPQWQTDKWEMGENKLGAQSIIDEDTLLRAMSDEEGVDLWGEVADRFDDEQMDAMLRKMTPITDEMMMETVEAGSGLEAQAEAEAEVPQPVVTATYVEDASVTDDGVAISAVIYTFETRDEYEERMAAEALEAQGGEQAAPQEGAAAVAATEETEAPHAMGEPVPTALHAMSTEAAAAAQDAEPVAQDATAEAVPEGTEPQQVAQDAAAQEAWVGAAPADGAEAEEPAAAEEPEATEAAADEPAPAEESAATEESAPVDEPAASEESEEPENQEEAAAEPQEDAEPVYPFGYTPRAYQRYWESPVGGISAMADEHPVVGIGDEGGIVLSKAYETPLNPEDKPVFGSQRMQTIQHGHVVLTLRIGVVNVNGNPRTRLILTKIAGEQDVGAMFTLDFDIMKPEIKGDAAVGLEGKLRKYKREDLYDYEFWADYAPLARYGREHLHVTVLSGRRDLSGDESNVEKLAQSATDLLLTWVCFDVSPLIWEGSVGRPTQVVQSFSWPGSMVFGDDKRYHSISNLQLNAYRTTDVPGSPFAEYETALITFIDRSADTPFGAISHKPDVARGHIGMVFVGKITDLTHMVQRYYTGFFLPESIEKLMGDIAIEDINELRFWGRVGDHYTFMMRSNIATYYYVMRLAPTSEYLWRGNDELIPKIKSIRNAGIQDGNTRLHRWIGRGDEERYLAAWAPLWSEEQAKNTPEDGSVDTPLCEVVIDDPEGTNPKLSATVVGPKDFSMSSFGAYGDFIYWPGTKSGVAEFKPNGADEADVQLEKAEPVNRSWLIGSRLRNGTFSEPFYLADLKREVDHVVSVSEATDALDVVCCGLVDREHGKGNVFHVRIPFVRCVTATEAAAEIPYVMPGHDANFFIVIRNDGNTFIGGCTVEMWNEGSVAASASLAFSKDTIQESTYNPAAADGSGLEGVEPDWALAPGKTSIYKVTIKIPDTWEGGYDENGERLVKTVKFRACSPTTKVSTGGAVAAQAENIEEEGIEYSLPESLAPMEAVEVDVYGYDDIDVKDAPMSVVKAAAPAAASGGSTTGGAASSPATTGGVTGRGTVPSTGDSGGLGVGGTLAAAAGAAMLAYERRRAKNEAQE